MRPNKRDELVRSALKVYYRDGFHATGMDKLVAETGISKTSMYKHFRTKEDLILAALRLRDEEFRNTLYRRMEELATTPRGQILAIFDVLAEWFRQPDFRGCMFIKAASEYLDAEDAIHALAAEHKRLLLDHLREVIAGMAVPDPNALARQILLLADGAIVAAQLAHTSDPAGDAKRAAEILVDAALAERRLPAGA